MGIIALIHYCKRTCFQTVFISEFRKRTWTTTEPAAFAGLPRSGKNIWKMNVFQVREKSQNFVDGQGNLERTWRVWEKSGNLKINSYGRQCSENLFILLKWGKDVLSHKIV